MAMHAMASIFVRGYAGDDVVVRGLATVLGMDIRMLDTRLIEILKATASLKLQAGNQAPPLGVVAPATGACLPQGMAVTSAPPVVAVVVAAEPICPPSVEPTNILFQTAPIANPAVAALQFATQHAVGQQSAGQRDWKSADGNEIIPRKNSTSHPAEWAQFTRAFNSGKKFHKTLGDWMVEEKADVFNTWLKNNKDLSKCEMVLQHRQSRRKTAEVKYGWRKLRDVAKDLYGGDVRKAKAVCDNRTSLGQVLKDEDHLTIQRRTTTS